MQNGAARTLNRLRPTRHNKTVRNSHRTNDVSELENNLMALGVCVCVCAMNAGRDLENLELRDSETKNAERHRRNQKKKKKRQRINSNWSCGRR